MENLQELEGAVITYQELKEYLKVDKLKVKLTPVTASKEVKSNIFKDGVIVGEETKEVKDIFPYAITFYANDTNQQVAVAMLNENKSNQLLAIDNLKVLVNCEFKVVKVRDLSTPNPYLLLRLLDLSIMVDLI